MPLARAVDEAPTSLSERGRPPCPCSRGRDPTARTVALAQVRRRGARRWRLGFRGANIIWRSGRAAAVGFQWHSRRWRNWRLRVGTRRCCWHRHIGDVLPARRHDIIGAQPTRAPSPTPPAASTATSSTPTRTASAAPPRQRHVSSSAMRPPASGALARAHHAQRQRLHAGAASPLRAQKRNLQ